LNPAAKFCPSPQLQMMYFDEQTILYHNGSWVPARQATASLYDQTLHYGTGVFEGIRAYDINGQPSLFRGKEHFARLIYSARAIQLPFSQGADALLEIAYELLRRNHTTEAYIRPFVYSAPMMALSQPPEAYFAICSWPWKKLLGDKLTTLTTSPYCRPHPRSCEIEAKVSGHYVNSILAATEARSRGYGDALQLDVDGYVAECSGANFFFEKNNILYTAPPGHILPGITRNTILQLCEKSGIEVRQKRFYPEEVHGTDAAFLVGTAAEVTGISALDDKPFRKNWADSIGYTLQRAYESATRSETTWENISY
jgi:branched-chain amino acid aminotransferase